MFACEHPSISYEVTHRTALPFHFVIHTLRCTECDTRAVVIDRRKDK